MNFVPLHLYSGYSFLRSGLSVPKIIHLAEKNHYYGVGLTDYETMTGLPEFYHAIKDKTLLPVYGMDVEVDGDLALLVRE
jgi:DNA polymerase-3 subunit alpha